MGRAKATAWVLLAYVVALGVALVAGYYCPWQHPLARIFVADSAATVAIFVFSFAFRNSSFYDAYWSVAPIVMVGFYLQTASRNGPDHLRAYLASAIVLAWGLRLTYNWYRGWTGMEHEDWRYREFQRKYPRSYWLISFWGIHYFPTLQVFLGCLSLYCIYVSPAKAFGPIDALGGLVGFGAVFIQGLADNQLRAFVTAPDRKREDILDTGIWAYSRHPNYFGEMSFWTSLALLATGAGFANYWVWVGPAAIIIMFVFVSLPMMTERMLTRRPGYQKRVDNVSAVIPWFPKRPS